jgi:hypothetical protein
MGTLTRRLALLVACGLLAALGLSACGGGDSTTDSTATSVESTATETTPSDEGGGEETTEGGSDSTGSDGSTSKGSGVGGSNVQPGERSSAFVTPGGDNSIQEFGSEGDSAERAEALKVIEGVYRSLETGDFEPLCDKYLSAKNLEQFELVAQKIPKFKNADCAEILSGLSPPRKGEKDPTRPKDGIQSIRGDDENSFAIYRGVDGKPYAWALAIEDDGFKVTALAPTPLNPGA